METVICFLCRVTLQEREELKEHLIYEHGEKVIPPTIIISYE